MNPSDADEEIRGLVDPHQQLRIRVGQTVEEFRETYSELLKILQGYRLENVSISLSV